VLWGFVYFICAVFAAMGVAFLAVGLRDVWKAARSKSWPQVAGKVVSAEQLQHQRELPQEAGGGTRLHYEARIHYEYTVGRVHIGSSVVRLGPTESSSEEQAQSTLARYLPGQPIQVSYNPRDPTESLLEPGANPGVFIRAVVGGILLILAFSLPFIARWFAARL
jgi:hypothetical protein